MNWYMGYVVVIAGLSAAFCVRGARWPDQRGVDVALIAGLVAVAVVCAIWLAGQRQVGVPGGEFAFGLVFGACVLAVLPALAYWWLGRALARWPIVLGGLWLVSLVPLGYYRLGEREDEDQRRGDEVGDGEERQAAAIGPRRHRHVARGVHPRVAHDHRQREHHERVGQDVELVQQE